MLRPFRPKSPRCYGSHGPAHGIDINAQSTKRIIRRSREIRQLLRREVVKPFAPLLYLFRDGGIFDGHDGLFGKEHWDTRESDREVGDVHAEMALRPTEPMGQELHVGKMKLQL